MGMWATISSMQWSLLLDALGSGESYNYYFGDDDFEDMAPEPPDSVSHNRGPMGRPLFPLGSVSCCRLRWRALSWALAARSAVDAGFEPWFDPGNGTGALLQAGDGGRASVLFRRPPMVGPALTRFE